MYIGAAQADVTTTVVNVIIVSRTTHFLKYIPWCALHLWWLLAYYWSTFMNQARSNVDFCIAWLILLLWLNRVQYEYGWWIARWNISIYSNVFIVLWHGALFWCNTTFSIRATKSERFFHNVCMRSRLTVLNKTTHHFRNVTDKFNKTFKHAIECNEHSRVTYSRVCCAVYLLIPAIQSTSQTVHR